MVVIRKKTYRAASVPVGIEEPVLVPDVGYHSHRSRLISGAAIDASDALSAASKRNDQYLMKEINDRLAHSALYQPSPVLSRRHSVSRAPSVSRPVSTALALVASSKPSGADNEVSRAVDLMMPTTSRVLRAGSVPPVLSQALVPLYSTPAVYKVPVYSNGYGSSLHVNGPLNYGYYIPPAPVHHSRYYVEPCNRQTTRNGIRLSTSFKPYADYSEGADIDALNIESYYLPPKVPMPDSHYYYPLTATRLTPTADIAVRQAHRDLDRIEQELKTDATLSPPAAPVPTIRTYATMEAGPMLRRRIPYYGGPVTGVYNPVLTSDYPSYDYYTNGVPEFSSYSTVPYNLSSTLSLPHTAARSFIYKPEADVLTIKSVPAIGESSSSYLSSYPSLPYYPYSSYSSYSSGAGISPASGIISANIDDVLRSAKSVPDISSLSSSYVRPSSAHVPSFSPSSASTAPAAPPVIKPQMSQARRRAREVLCRVKNDPKYFDQ